MNFIIPIIDVIRSVIEYLNPTIHFGITLISFALVLGVTIFVHELGHFLFAKKAGIYVYEFAIGMGPTLFKWRRKNDETLYSIHLLPIGGFTQMAGEEIEPDEKIPEEKRMQSKTWIQRFLVIVAGVMFNFILAIFVFFMVSLIQGAPQNDIVIGAVEATSASASAGLQVGDEIVAIDGKKVHNSDTFMLELQVRMGNPITLDIERNCKREKITVVPEKIEEDDKISYRYGFGLKTKVKKGILASIQYAFTKTIGLLEQMVMIIVYLFTGKLSLNSLAGPVGIFSVVGEASKAGFLNLIYLIGFLCVNVGFINLLPFPAFDGGRVVFLIIEKIKGSPVKPKVENTINAIGFVLLMILMVMITWNDIMRLF